MKHNIGKYLIVGVNPSICDLRTRRRSTVSFELWGTFVPWGKSALDNQAEPAAGIDTTGEFMSLKFVDDMHKEF